MKALAFLLKLKKLKLTSASHAFRRKLDEGCKKKDLPNASSTDLAIEADDVRREGVLVGLLQGMISELRTPGVTQSLVPKQYAAALLKSLKAILASKQTMQALSQRNHIIRSEGNDSAHSLQSLSMMQVKLIEDEDHPLGEESKEAAKVLAQMFIDVPCLLPTPPT